MKLKKEKQKKPAEIAPEPVKAPKIKTLPLGEVTAAQLSILTGKSYRTIQAKLARVKSIREDKTAVYYIPKDALEAIYETDVEKTYSHQEQQLQKEKLKFEKYRAEKAQIEVERLRGESFGADIVEKVLTGMCANFRARSLAIPTKTALQCLGKKEVREIEEIIRAQIYDALNEFKEYDPKLFLDGFNPSGSFELSPAAEVEGERMGRPGKTA